MIEKCKRAGNRVFEILDILIFRILYYIYNYKHLETIDNIHILLALSIIIFVFKYFKILFLVILSSIFARSVYFIFKIIRYSRRIIRKSNLTSFESGEKDLSKYANLKGNGVIDLANNKVYLKRKTLKRNELVQYLKVKSKRNDIDD